MKLGKLNCNRKLITKQTVEVILVAVTSLKRSVYKVQQHNHRAGKKYEAAKVTIYSHGFNW
jgi:hypothetical protein